VAPESRRLNFGGCFENSELQNGAFHGAGKVASAGEDGAVVSDHSGREHRIHWHEVKGHCRKISLNAILR